MRYRFREMLVLARSLIRWIALGLLVGALAGAGSAGFLHALAAATRTQEAYPWLLYLLPAAGVGIAWVYRRYGTQAEGGNNLLLDSIHDPAQIVPLRMAPLIVGSTVVTHLFGGSAGREGSAVQMGGSLTTLVSRSLRLGPADRRLLVMAGISGGFGSVFGTPLAGMVFGLEVLAIGRMRYDALISCFVASLAGDLVCERLGVVHEVFRLGPPPPLTAGVVLAMAGAGLAFGAASWAFVELTEGITHAMRRLIARPLVRPVVGGLAIIALTHAVGSRDYLGLSLPLIARSFQPGEIVAYAFALKIVFTAVTLGSGFKGGEVTPLFCVGATLGHAIATQLGEPPELFAALGFVSVFAGAANTPLTGVLLGMELFGAPFGVPVAITCLISYVMSGHRGIYSSQQIDTPKATSIVVSAGIMLKDAHGTALNFQEPRPVDVHTVDTH